MDPKDKLESSNLNEVDKNLIQKSKNLYEILREIRDKGNGADIHKLNSMMGWLLNGCNNLINILIKKHDDLKIKATAFLNKCCNDVIEYLKQRE
jgi:hypothetical protein